MLVVEEGRFQAIALLSTDVESYAWLPYALVRIAKFAEQYDSDAAVPLLVAHLKQSFAIDGPALIMILLADGKLVGHLLASMEEWYGTPFCTVVQVELDRAAPRRLMLQSLRYVEGWAAHKGANFMQCLARNDRVARAFATFYGFTRNRIIMRKPLSTAVAPGAETA